MPEVIQLSLSPREAFQTGMLKDVLVSRAGIPEGQFGSYRILKRSVDARSRVIRVHLRVEVYRKGEESGPPRYRPTRQDVHDREPVVVVGSGPAGLFASLRLIDLGMKPVILERGKEVSSRKRDLALISREHRVDPDSNYCFGEGGAGTFSDGKLYTRSKKRGDIRRVLEEFCFHGAPEAILYDSHPHIGTDLLPAVIRRMRETIQSSGGTFHFGTRVTGLLVSNGEVEGVISQGGDRFMSRKVILATGHSARDVYEMLARMGLALESKDFAMGVRIEHPQDLIDSIQYQGGGRGPWLPAASYQLAARAGGRGVFSFCMCPGGFVVPAATSREEVVVNGMSPSKRNSPYANSGIVTEIRAGDLRAFSSHGPLAGLRLQQSLERQAWRRGGETQRAPAQRLTDFLAGKSSGSLPANSYFPGTVSSSLHEWLPAMIRDCLREGFRIFDRRMKGFLTGEAVILGVESRTSSPVRIPRDEVSLQHPQVKGLFPAGEGSGYSGGIMSSAIDGIRCAEKCLP